MNASTYAFRPCQEYQYHRQKYNFAVYLFQLN